MNSGAKTHGQKISSRRTGGKGGLGVKTSEVLNPSPSPPSKRRGQKVQKGFGPSQINQDLLSPAKAETGTKGGRA